VNKPSPEAAEVRRLEKAELARAEQIEREWRQARYEKMKAGYDLDPCGHHLDGGCPRPVMGLCHRGNRG
jgi:hypothetical protein